MFTKKSMMYDPLESGSAEILRINVDGSYSSVVVDVFSSLGSVKPAELEYRERAEGMVLEKVTIGERSYGMWIPQGKKLYNEKASKLLGREVRGNVYIIRFEPLAEYLEDEDIEYIKRVLG